MENWMESMKENTNWYVVQVSTGSEHKLRDMIVKQLEQTGTPYEDCFVPMVEYVRKVDKKYETKERPMFPGYLFIISASTTQQVMHQATQEATQQATEEARQEDNADADKADNIQEIAAALKQVIGFTKVLGEGGAFIPLYPKEVEFLLGFSDNQHNVGMSCGFIENDKVTVTQGPLVGKEGCIRKINRHKRVAEVEVFFMGRATRVQVPLEIVTKR